jgi:signal transduction histidine kinase/CheY-like chemotaxis protein
VTLTQPSDSSEGAVASKIPKRPARILLAPGFVFVLGLLATLGATFAAFQFVSTGERARFERLVAVAQGSLSDRLGADVDAVHAAAGLFAIRGELTQAGFERFVHHLSPTWLLRTRSAGWAERLPAERTAFSTSPAPQAPSEPFAVRYVHPSNAEGPDRVDSALGRDPRLRATMERAAAIGDVATSLPITLGDREGFFLFFPVFRSGAPLETASERYAALHGFVFATVYVDALTTGIRHSPSVKTTVGPEPLPPGFDQKLSMMTGLPFGPLAFKTTRTVRVGDREWPIHFQSTEVFSEESSWRLIYLTLILACSITLLFTAVTWSESSARANAEATSQRLTESEEALRRANAAKDEFLGVVSHELRNPLGAMAGALSVLRLRGDLTDRAAKRALEIAERQVRQQSRLVDDLLDVTRLTTSNVLLDVGPVDLNEVLSRSVTDARAAAALRGHQLAFTPWKDAVIVEGDVVRLEQVANNLLTNSIKYTPHGGSIDVSVRADGGEASFTVRDDGAGIPTHLLDAIFTPFFQERLSDTASKGLGLGLTIAQRLVTLHGGRIAAHSDGQGCGTEVTVTLPRSRARPIPSPPIAIPLAVHPPVATQRDSGALHAVVIDDMDDGREVLRVLLEALGLQVDEAATGKSGLELIQTCRPEVAFVDIDLPDMSGLEIAMAIRDARIACHLVAVTGYGSTDDADRAHRAGFHDYLIKPVDMSKLAELVGSLSPGRVSSVRSAPGAT